MYNSLVDKARTRRLGALASVPGRTENVISLSHRRADRHNSVPVAPFVSTRTLQTPVRRAG